MKKNVFLFLIIIVSGLSAEHVDITSPKLTNNPSYDVTATNPRPLLSFFISRGGIGKRTYTIQLDTSDKFNSSDFIEYTNVEEENEFLAAKRVEYPLKDKVRYYWRVKAIDEKKNESKWATSRFYTDTDYNKHYTGLSRIPVQSIEVSTGEDPKNLYDLNDPGQVTFWQAAPPGPISDWVVFDLGEAKEIKRIWMLSNINTDDGWLEEFRWQSSMDGNNFTTIEEGHVTNNDTYINTIDIPKVETRYMRLKIDKFRGVAPHLNAMIFYSEDQTSLPAAPDKDYVLVIGNQMNGGTFTQLVEFIKDLPLNLDVLLVPHYQVSLEKLNGLEKKPIAIVLSGNNADYPNLPMFEYNGEFEIIRSSDIPILGICCGHQMLAMTYGFTFVRSMGWEDLTALEKLSNVKPIHIVKKDPIFRNIKNPFIAPEIHGWSIAQIPDGFELLAESTYVQAIRSKNKFIYGEQFHAEVEVPYNGGTNYLINFLKMAMNKNMKKQ